MELETDILLYFTLFRIGSDSQVIENLEKASEFKLDR